MTAIPRPRSLAIALTLILAASLGASAARAEGQLVERQYRVRFIDTSVGIAIASNFCAGPECRVGMGSMGGFVLVRADPATQERIAKALAEADVPPADQAFQLVLLQADRSGTGAPADLPAGPRKALADLQGFLPYSRYRLIDSAFVRTTHDARVVVRGMADRAYEAQITFRGDPRQPGAELLVERFVLRMIPADPMGLLMGSAGEGARGTRRQGEATGSQGATPAPAPSAAPPAGGGDASPAPPAPSPTLAENLLNTSFSLRRGETVVVGTSKLDAGSSALVVLLTALP
jgi:hypothetical protein